MILSVSRRTDIPAFYGEWFINRLKEGFVFVRNPFNFHQISKIKLNIETLDFIVFWTKDATDFMQYLDIVDEYGYKYYFQYTITPYDKTIESGLRDKKFIIENFINLSKRLGKEKMIWRYDPILLSDKINMEFHVNAFEEMAKKLSSYTNTVIISFLDDYKKVGSRLKMLRKLNINEMLTLAVEFSKIAKRCNLEIKTCAEKLINENVISRASCIDKELVSKILGNKIIIKKDKNQRKECLCVESLDIGEYDTCHHLCEYCYANGSKIKVQNNCRDHNKTSALLIGNITEKDIVKNREIVSIINHQSSFFD